MNRVRQLFYLVHILVATTANGFPLATEDTGTRGYGKSKLELNAELSEKSDANVREESHETELGMSYGFSQDVDVAIVLVYKDERVYDALDETHHVEGKGDSKISMKWRFFSGDVHSTGIKTGLYLPTGDEEKGLGTGTTNPFINLIYTRESNNTEWNLDLGYRWNQGQDEQRDALWHLSSAIVWRMADYWKVGAEIGTDSSRDRGQSRYVSFGTLAGSFYLTRQWRLDAGVRMTDIPSGQLLTWLAGINHVF